MTITNRQVLSSAFENCSVTYNGMSMGYCDFLRENTNIISDLLCSDECRRGIIINSGSKTLLILSIILASLTAFIKDNGEGDSILDKLVVGDMVIYKNKRGVYKGKDSEDRLIIESDCTYYIPLTSAHKIQPYYGKATSLNGRGIKNNSIIRNRILSSIFKLPIESVKNSTNCSIIIVCNKQDAFEVMDGLSIGLIAEKTIRLSEVFPAAYYTAGDVIQFAGNSANIEPVLKFTSKLSVARELILEDRNRDIIGMLVNGSEYMGVESTELVSLLKRRSLQSVMLISELSSNCYSDLKGQCEELELYAWTNETINKLSDIYNFGLESSTATELKTLYRMLKNNVGKTVLNSVIEAPLNDDYFDECRKSLYRIVKSEYSDSDKEYFVTRAFSLQNLFEHACFPIECMEKAIQSHVINALSPSEELLSLQGIALKYKGSLGEDMATVVTLLSDIKNALYNRNPKFEHLADKIYENYYSAKEKIAVIIPKAFYFEVFKESLSPNIKHILDLCEFSTVRKVNPNVPFDNMIFVGIFDWYKTNPLAIDYASTIEIMCYPFQTRIYNAVINAHRKQLQIYNKDNKIEFYHDNIRDESQECVEVLDQEYSSFIYEFEDYINKAFVSSTMSSIKSTGAETGSSEIVRIATFETGECAFFTKNYKPYILDISKGIVIEAEVSEIQAGDSLIFTTNDNETKDVVEKIMRKLVESNRCDEKFKEAYWKSLYWKKVLKEFIEKNNMTYRETSRQMYNIGRGKHEVTLRTWLDEECHIVGPRDSDSFYAIALLTGDEAMLKDPDAYCGACSEVRSMRVRVLRYIATNMLNSFGRASDPVDELFASVAGDLSKISQILQIEKIVDTEKNVTVPSYMTNRPHNF